jgi:hypothetical protein
MADNASATGIKATATLPKLLDPERGERVGHVIR